jgi:hypothetical protein
MSQPIHGMDERKMMKSDNYDGNGGWHFMNPPNGNSLLREPTFWGILSSPLGMEKSKGIKSKHMS